MFQNNICNALLHCFWHIHWTLTRLVMKLANNSSGMQKRLLISGLFPAPWWKLWKATVSVLYIFPPLQCSYWQDIGSTQPVTMSTHQQILYNTYYSLFHQFFVRSYFSREQTYTTNLFCLRPQDLGPHNWHERVSNISE